jgi:hypothetical protein
MAIKKPAALTAKAHAMEHRRSGQQHLVRQSIERLASLADCALRAGRSILAHLPVQGRRWMFAGRSLPPSAAHDVIWAMTELEHKLNPTWGPECPVPEPDACEVFQAVGMTPPWQLYVPCVEDLLWCRKRILADLGWASWPWQFEHPLRAIAPAGPEGLILAAQLVQQRCEDHERLLTADMAEEKPNPALWAFLPGSFIYQNREYPLKGTCWKLLKEFVEAENHTLTLHEITYLNARRTSTSRAYSAVSELRSALRRLLGPDAGDNPLRLIDRETYRLFLAC